MPWMKALVLFPYFGKNRQPGESFEASESDARVLELVGKAERDGNRAEVETHANVNPAQQYQTRDMTAVPSRGRGRRTPQ